jgi:hypothetical protein
MLASTWLHEFPGIHVAACSNFANIPTLCAAIIRNLPHKDKQGEMLEPS